MDSKPARSLNQAMEQALLPGQLAEALDQSLQLLDPNEEDHIPVLLEGWAALSKAEGQPIEFFWELRGLETAPHLLDSIGVNEWEWACSFDLPTGYAVRVVATQSARNNDPHDLWWTLAIVSPEREHGSVSFTVGTVGGEDVQRIIRICETALCYKGYNVFEGTDTEWETYLQSVSMRHSE